ncbi:hypothetical protein LTR66_004598 [Elasticomyces elasticus]|nr:hypothetical protein LTR66_004598 [Elasticomyces elasticus]
MRPKQKQISFGFCDTITGERVYDPTNMYTRLVCSPSLGRPTVIASNQKDVPFSVLVETTAPLSDLQVEVSVWHNHGDCSAWTELALEPSAESGDVLIVTELGRPQTVYRQWFTATLAGTPQRTEPVSFTIKFRIGGKEGGYQWVQDAQGDLDGTLHYQGTAKDFLKNSPMFSYFIDGGSHELEVKAEIAETSETHLYSVTGPTAPAQGRDSGISTYALGTPSEYTRWFSLVRLWSPWLAPRHGKAPFHVDKAAVLASFLRNDGLHVVCLAISGVYDVLTWFEDDHGQVIIKARSDSTSEQQLKVVVAVAKTFNIANAAVMYHARKVVMNNAAGQENKELEELMKKDLSTEWMEEWYDGLTYCTWNGLGQDLNEYRIFGALDSLHESGINITNLIIDDNWQSLSDGATQFQKAWLEFEANKPGFPGGLKHTVSEIRRQHPGIVHIAVWHAILGYWGGVSADGKIAKEYKTIEVEKRAGVAGGKMRVVAAEDAQRMYDDFYRYAVWISQSLSLWACSKYHADAEWNRFLSSTGITGVKTDAQFFLDELNEAPTRRDLIATYQDAWTLAHLRHFSSRAISCMSQSPQILFHSQLPTNKPRLLVRNSDDFFPEVPASHPWHIFCNAGNSLLTQHLNVLPDWDMFQTSHPWASFHGAARCVSGGPIYFTDEPKKHDIKLINQMTAQTPRGNTVILRPHQVGKTVESGVYSGYEEQALLKIGTYVGFAKTGTGILGVFNVGQRTLSEFVPLDDFPGTEEGRYIVSSFTTGQVSAPIERGSKTSIVGLEIAVQGWEILTASPLRNFTLKSGNADVALLGLLGKMTGAAAIINTDMYVEDSGRLKIWVSLKALGVLGVYVSDLARRSIEDDLFATLFGKPIGLDMVRKSDSDPNVLEIDVEKAWKESDQRAGWSNEVHLDIFIR